MSKINAEDKHPKKAQILPFAQGVETIPKKGEKNTVKEYNNFEDFLKDCQQEQDEQNELKKMQAENRRKALEIQQKRIERDLQKMKQEDAEKKHALDWVAVLAFILAGLTAIIPAIFLIILLLKF